MTRDLSALRDYILAVLTESIGEKEKQGIHPCTVLAEEIYTAVKTDVQQCLNGFVKDGILGFHKTLNSISFHFKELPKDDEENKSI